MKIGRFKHYHDDVVISLTSQIKFLLLTYKCTRQKENKIIPSGDAAMHERNLTNIECGLSFYYLHISLSSQNI